jgi:predicted DNA binding protein
MTVSAGIWVREVSTSYPTATFRLLTGVPRGDRALELGEVRAANPAVVTETIKNHPDVSKYEQLYVDDQRAVGQYEADERGLYEFLWGSSLPPEFPIVVENGTMEFDVTMTQEQFDRFGSMLDDSGRQYDLLTLVHTDDRDGLLTPRQREHLTLAYRLGYFDVPRECTLAELADELGVHKSSASETIRRGTARIVGQFIFDRDGSSVRR